MKKPNLEWKDVVIPSKYPPKPKNGKTKKSGLPSGHSRILKRGSLVTGEGPVGVNNAMLTDFIKQYDALQKELRDKDLLVKQLHQRLQGVPEGTTSPIEDEISMATHILRGFEQKLIDLDSPAISQGSTGRSFIDQEVV
ncbi:hypothetical protein R1sor_007809 [Riccia sorocarpa]|uniref:Uncharacterized protein n=1 Tax=Riccia sorocarpa TaxID=122646 RepID=A0ABD3HRJ8_9MARC